MKWTNYLFATETSGKYNIELIVATPLYICLATFFHPHVDSIPFHKIKKTHLISMVMEM